MNDSGFAGSDDAPPRSPTRIEVTVAGYRGDTATVAAGWGSTDPLVRASTLTALVRSGALTDDVLLEGIGDSATVVARRAIEIAAIAAPAVRAVDRELVAILLAEDDTLAEVAAFALGERHQEAPSSEVLDGIVTALGAAATRHRDPLVREAAVAALGSVGDPAGLPAVLAATTDKATVRRRAVLALAAFEGDTVDAALEKARTDRDWQVRQAAEDLTNPRA